MLKKKLGIGRHTNIDVIPRLKFAQCSLVRRLLLKMFINYVIFISYFILLKLI